MGAFIRRITAANENIVVSVCAKCGAVAGASASQAILRIAEQSHNCRMKASPDKTKKTKGPSQR